MLRKYFYMIATALIAQSCSADINQEKIQKIKIVQESNFLFSSMYKEDQILIKKKDFEDLLNKKWFKPFPVKDKNGTEKSLDNCEDLLENITKFTELEAFRYSDFNFHKMHCMAIKYISDSSESKKSFLPKDLVFKNSPQILPKEFIPIYSMSDEDAINAMPALTRWESGIKVKQVDDSDKGIVIFYQVEQDQVLAELARADFNNDGIEDALLYMRTKINGGSHETNKIYTVTAGEDGVIKTLDIYPNDD